MGPLLRPTWCQRTVPCVMHTPLVIPSRPLVILSAAKNLSTRAPSRISLASLGMTGGIPG